MCHSGRRAIGTLKRFRRPFPHRANLPGSWGDAAETAAEVKAAARSPDQEVFLPPPPSDNLAGALEPRHCAGGENPDTAGSNDVTEYLQDRARPGAAGGLRQIAAGPACDER